MDIFKEIIKEITPLLKELGLEKKGNNFYLLSDKNYGIINFQKSKESTKEILFFTINLGIYSDVLGKLESFYQKGLKPDIEQCHWMARIGHFLVNGSDYWWKVNITDDLKKIVFDLMKTVQDIILPEINRHLTDDDLINYWRIEQYAGTTEIGRFKYLTTLLKEKGEHNILDQFVIESMSKFKGKPNFILAKNHLEEISYNLTWR